MHPDSARSHAAIWAVFERARRLISEAEGSPSGSMPASGAMPVENEPDLGYPSRSEYVRGAPARRKTRSEKVPESDFGQREPPPADTATTTYPGSRKGLIPCEWSPRWARGDPMGPYGGRYSFQGLQAETSLGPKNRV